MEHVITIIIFVLPVLSIFTTMWLMGRRPVNLTVNVRFIPEGDDPDEDELEPDVLPDEAKPTAPEVMRFN